MKLKEYKLGDLIEVTRGMSLPGEFYSTEGEYIRLTCGNFDYVNNSFKENKSKDDLYYVGKIKPEFIMEKGDIITPLTEQAIGLLGSTAIIPESGKYIQSQDVAKVTCKKGMIDHDFAYYLIPSKCVKEQLSAAAQQTKIRHTSPDAIKACKVFVPPLSEQKKIASVLSALDDKIALNKKMNQKLEAMAKRLYDYWFVQYDFPDKNGHPYKTTGGPMTYNETLKREIPAGWEVRTLGEYLDCNKYSLTAKSYYDFIQYLDTSSLTENTLESLQRYESIAESPSRAKRIVHANDILYSTVRPQQKHYGIIKNPAQNMIASTGFAILSCKYGFEYNDMFYLFLIQEKNLIKLSAIADSNASSYPSFNPSDLLNLSICLPEDIKTIEPLVKKFSSLFGIIERNQKENQKLSAFRDKLLPLLMNGQVVID